MPDETDQDRPATLRELNTAVAASEQRITAAITEAIAASEARAAERARDLQTEILKGLESFARGNFARFHSVETRSLAVEARTQATDSNVVDINTRIAALEERVLYLETRRPA
jgi:hypothetical protein